MDAFLDWKADLHTCGRPMSESLRVEDREDPEYVIGTQICVACMALEEHRAVRADGDKAYHERHVNPDAWRNDVVVLVDEAARDPRRA